ncbi:hypothetical protein DdX_19571 [Ditylenchus destructor]|uniref:Uncharacterized protein n=1 Tax=Ditylenchus destructor TaxID=166010 RepID=A0AAD4QXA6_9BILA|nr:hypothetical protein DdX_19571 [Ditylenchus destructor]
MRILTVILLLPSTYIVGNSPLLPPNEVRMQSAAKIINDEDYGQLIYNKSAMLVRKKREMSDLKIAILTEVLSYACFIAIDATPFKPYVRSRLQHWGVRESNEELYWKSLAVVVNTNVHLDKEGYIHNKKGIGNFINAPADLRRKIQEFREEAAEVIEKKLEDEQKEEARMLSEKQNMKSKDGHNVSERVKVPEDLDQMSKAIMADSMIDTLIGIDGMGGTTWKYNPNNQEHRTLYEGLLKAKHAIEAKYKNKCPLKEFTAAELPAYKSLFARILGPIPAMATSLYKVFNDVLEEYKEERKVEQRVSDVYAKVIDSDLAKKITKIHGMFEEVLLSIGKDAEAARERANSGTKLSPETGKNVPNTKNKVKKE